MYSKMKNYLNFSTEEENGINMTVNNNVEKYTYENDTLNLAWQTSSESINTSDPKIWGPAFWFSLHMSATYYPIEASQIVKERMKGRILAIPYEIPCSSCRPHAIAFIESRKHDLDNIVSGRRALGQFYVDFHNKVNERYGKKQYTYDEAYKMYSTGKNLSYLK